MEMLCILQLLGSESGWPPGLVFNVSETNRSLVFGACVHFVFLELFLICVNSVCCNKAIGGALKKSKLHCVVIAKLKVRKTYFPTYSLQIENL